MQKKFHSKFSITVVSCVALTFALGRCGPITQSVDKNSFRLDGSFGPNVTSADSTLKRYFINQTSSQTEVSDHMDAPQNLQPNPGRKIVLVPGDPKFAEFQLNRKTTLVLDSAPVSPISATFEVSVPYGTNLSGFSVGFSESMGTTWELGPSQAVSPNLWNAVSTNLQSITLIFNAAGVNSNASSPAVSSAVTASADASRPPSPLPSPTRAQPLR